MINIINFLVLIHDLKKGNKKSCDYNVERDVEKQFASECKKIVTL